MPFFAIFGHFLAIFGRFGPFLDREHQKQCNCNLLGATGPKNYINMVSNGYLEIWSVSDPKTNSGAKQDPKLTWGGQNWSFCTLCSPTNLFYTKNVNSEMVTSKSYFLAWNRPCEEWLYLVQVRQQEKSAVIAGAATGRVGLKYLIWEGAKSPAQGLPWNTLVW